MVVGEKVRKKDLSCDYHNSMGLKSGEYGDKQITFAPTLLIIGLIDASLCAGFRERQPNGKLSIITTAPVHN